MSGGGYEGLVVAGPTRFHAVDADLTAMLENQDVFAELELLAEDRRGNWWGIAREVVARLVPEGKLPEETQPFTVYMAARSFGKWQPGWGVPSCNMIDPGPAITVAEAEAAGLVWSLECAKRVGVIETSRTPPWRVLKATFEHVQRCRVCREQGTGACSEFPFVVAGEPVPARPVKARPRVAAS